MSANNSDSDFITVFTPDEQGGLRRMTVRKHQDQMRSSVSTGGRPSVSCPNPCGACCGSSNFRGSSNQRTNNTLTTARPSSFRPATNGQRQCSTSNLNSGPPPNRGNSRNCIDVNLANLGLSDENEIHLHVNNPMNPPTDRQPPQPVTCSPQDMEVLRSLLRALTYLESNGSLDLPQSGDGSSQGHAQRRA